MNRRAFTLIELLFVVAVIAVLAAIAVPNFLEAQVRSKVSRTKADQAVITAALRAYSADFDAYPANDPLFQNHLRRLAAEDDLGFQDLQEEAEAHNEANPEQRVHTPTHFLAESGDSLAALTTPVAYFTRRLPENIFIRPSNYNWWDPRSKGVRTKYTFLYINQFDILADLDMENESPFLRYYLFSPGPAGNFPFSTHSVDSSRAPRQFGMMSPGVSEEEASAKSKPGFDFFQRLPIPYDPTNGTVSSGVLPAEP